MVGPHQQSLITLESRIFLIAFTGRAIYVILFGRYAFFTISPFLRLQAASLRVLIYSQLILIVGCFQSRFVLAQSEY